MWDMQLCKHACDDSVCEYDGFLTCTTRTDRAGRRSGSRASSSSRWCVTTSSALSAFTSSAYLRKGTRVRRGKRRGGTATGLQITTGNPGGEAEESSGSPCGEAVEVGPERVLEGRRDLGGGAQAGEHLVVHLEAAAVLVRPPPPPRRPRTAAAAPAPGDPPRPWI